MAAKLKFYDVENQMFKRENHIYLNENQALKIITAVSTYFKIPIKSVVFYRHKCGSSTTDYEVRLNFTPSLLYLIHELAHLHNLYHYGNWKHNKQLLNTINAMVTYCNMVLKAGQPQAKTVLQKIKITAKRRSKPLRNRKSLEKRLGAKQLQELFSFCFNVLN